MITRQAMVDSGFIFSGGTRPGEWETDWFIHPNFPGSFSLCLDPQIQGVNTTKRLCSGPVQVFLGAFPDTKVVQFTTTDSLIKALEDTYGQTP